MSNFILKNNKLIWQGSNNLFEILYLHFNEYTKNEKIGDNIKKFIENLNQDIYGRGCIVVDINEFFKKKEDILLVICMLKKIIDEGSVKYEWAEDFKKHVSEFCNVLELEYKD